MRVVLAQLPADHGHRLVIQRYADRLARLRLVRMYPCAAVHEIDLRPLQAEHIRTAQAGGQREGCHVAQPVGLDRLEQRVRFLACDPADPLRSLRFLLQPRGLVQPFPLVHRRVEHAAQCREVEVLRADGDRACRLRPPVHGGQVVVDVIGRDVVDVSAGEHRAPISDVQQLVAVVGRARVLLQEPDRHLVEGAAGALAELRGAPQLVLHLVVQLLRLLSVGRASSLSNSAAAWFADIEVPDVGLFALSDRHDACSWLSCAGRSELYRSVACFNFSGQILQTEPIWKKPSSFRCAYAVA
ncbi:hypothetical protein WI32_03135 [Burkholderia ubonensis]|nr:hypothetical protein WI32_03135 [Burkholderia ubonensis]KUZ56852.1 hypothetical protein WI33_04670 [Burkholderia ubonensis]KUZ58580.1 hypothetical protein WI34_15840 [Burkholderia ubonensis]